MPLFTRVVVDASDPLHASFWEKRNTKLETSPSSLVSESPSLTHKVALSIQILSQSLILELERFGELTVPIHAPEVGLLPGCLLPGDVVALVADALEVWWTHGVHSLVSDVCSLRELIVSSYCTDHGQQQKWNCNGEKRKVNGH